MCYNGVGLKAIVKVPGLMIEENYFVREEKNTDDRIERGTDRRRDT